jgi:hypothetical protein
MKVIAVIAVLLHTGFTIRVFAQDIESVIKSKPFELGGGSMNLATVFHSSFDVPTDQPGFSFYASGNINFHVFGQSAPLSFNYTNRKLNYAQPFNNFSFAPRYKWVALRVGSHSVNYSPYTMAGHRLTGASVELTPGKFKVNMAYGKLKKAILPDSLDADFRNVTFERWGMAAGLEYANKRDRVYFTVFNGKDNAGSVPVMYHSDDNTPKENTAVSAGFVKQIMDKLTIDGEVAVSLLNRDITNDLQRRLTRQQFYVYKTNLSYSGNGYGLTFGIEHVDPEYITLGGYYFNNDLQKYTIGGLTSLLNGRVNVNAQLGLEQNNLQNTETNTTSRWVGALNGTFQASSRLNLSACYSNFTAFTNVRPTAEYEYLDEMDTLNYQQINQSGSFSAILQLGNRQLPQNLAMNTSLQTSGFSGHGADNNPGSTFLSNTLSYGLSIPDKSLTFSASVTSYMQEYSNNTTRSTGPSVSLGKAYLEKQLKSTWALSYNRGEQQENPATQVYSVRWNLTFQSKRKKEKQEDIHSKSITREEREKETVKNDQGFIKESSSLTGRYLPEELSLRKEKTKTIKKEPVENEKTTHVNKFLNERHRFNLSAVFTHRDLPGARIPKYSELTMRITYAYSF